MMDSPLTLQGDKLRVVIIGGGISGLSAAWYLQKQAAARRIALDYSVLEQSARWGGKILTETVDGPDGLPFVVEAGPDAFLTQKPWALQLARELGLGERLLGTNDAKRRVFVLKNGRPVVLPDGVQLIVPTRFLPFLLSPLVSPAGKLRMALDLVLPARQDDEDETLADFILRRLGREALDRIAEPLMAGIYSAEAHKQSIMATFPRFRAIERQHGSLIRGMIAAARQRAAQPGSSAVPAFMSLYGGTSELVEALVPQLDGNLRLNTQVTGIEQTGQGQYRAHLQDGTALTADTVILTTPAYVTAPLLQGLAPTAADLLSRIRYVSTGTISLAFKQDDIPHPLDGFGLVIPMSEKRPINAVTMSSVKFDRRAPAGYVLLRAFFGGARTPQTMQLDDAELLQTVQAELQSILGIRAGPLLQRIYRWWQANPQYDVGHLERVNMIEAALPAGLYVTGSAYRGVGIPDCIHQSQQTADKILADFTERIKTDEHS